MKTYWFVGHDEFGRQFGCTISAETEKKAIELFYKEYSHSSDYDDYGCYDDEEK